jgi:hypothetical protein
MKNIPNKLFLVIGDDAEDIDNFNNLDHEYVCWSKQRTDVSDIEYVHISDRDKFAIEFADWCDKLSFMDKVTVHPIAGSGGSSGPRELTNSELLETYLRKLFHSQKQTQG